MKKIIVTIILTAGIVLGLCGWMNKSTIEAYEKDIEGFQNIIEDLEYQVDYLEDQNSKLETQIVETEEQIWNIFNGKAYEVVISHDGEILVYQGQDSIVNQVKEALNIE